MDMRLIRDIEIQDGGAWVPAGVPSAPAADHVYALFERQAEQAPDRIAIVATTHSWTYGQLLDRSRAAAAWFGRQRPFAEEPVAVWMERSPAMVALMLGLMAGGACYVPIDPQDPPQRVRRMLRVAGVRRVVGDAALLEPLRASDPAGSAGQELPRLIDANEVAQALAPAVAPRCSPGGDRLAYLMFTSGSSGEPKAVEVEHRSVVNLLHAVRDLIAFDADDRYLAVSTIAFDISVAELFLPLVCGGSLLLRDRHLLLEPQRLASDLRTHGVTVFQTGPSVWSLLLAEVADFPRVRVAITTGEAIAPELALRVGHCGEQVWNLYGPTEATVWATGHRLDPAAAEPPGLSAASAPIGRALHGLWTQVVDAQGRTVADGETGELWIGGAGVARCYRGLATATQERFLLEPCSGQRMYRTGDRVARSADGTLHYFGRDDDQIKVRGVRIEPAEVEAALLCDPRVAQAAVTWFEGPRQARSVVAAVVLHTRAVGSAQDLAARLGTQLPAPMIPARIVIVDTMPLTASGKIDRIAIRHAAAHAPPALSGDAASRALTATEQAIAPVWQRLLGLPQVSPADHFFTLGGDSLSAVEMMVEVEAVFGMTLPVQLAFEAPTLQTLARRVDRLQARPDDLGNTDFVFPIVESGAGAPLFFSNVDLKLARHGLWMVDCPLHALANWARGSGFVQAQSLAALASAHLAALRRVQPTGPYRLAGYSMGGLIAFEVAQQLHAAHEEVELLFLLDPMTPFRTTVPDLPPAPSSPRDPLGVRLRRRLQRIVDGPRRIGLAAWARLFLPAASAPIIQWATYRLVHLHGRYPNPVSQRLLPRERWGAFWYAARRLAVTYEARPYTGRTLAVFTDDGASAATWRGLLRGPVDLRVLPTDHRSLFAEQAMSRWMPWLADALGRRG